MIDDGIILAFVCMGEVYREHDMNLPREVAMEVLRAALAHDLVARFERKAIILAAKSHLNINIFHGLKITVIAARATNEEEAYGTTPMDELGAHSSFCDAS